LCSTVTRQGLSRVQGKCDCSGCAHPHLHPTAPIACCPLLFCLSLFELCVLELLPAYARHLPLSHRTTMTTQMRMTMSLSLVSCVAARQCGRKELCLWRAVSAWNGSICTSVVAKELLARRPRPRATSACVACAVPKSFYYIIHHFLDFLYFSTMHIWSIFLYHILVQGHSQKWTWD
jgi:hypothetical protein